MYSDEDYMVCQAAAHDDGTDRGRAAAKRWANFRFRGLAPEYQASVAEWIIRGLEVGLADALEELPLADLSGQTSGGYLPGSIVIETVRTALGEEYSAERDHEALVPLRDAIVDQWEEAFDQAVFDTVEEICWTLIEDQRQREQASLPLLRS